MKKIMFWSVVAVVMGTWVVIPAVGFWLVLFGICAVTLWGAKTL